MADIVLISLVSEQTIPNVMAVLQDDEYFEYLEFIVSADKDRPLQYDRKYDEAYQRIKVFLEKQGRVVTRQAPVNPYDLKQTLKVCQEAVNTHRKMGRQVIFNITGGTKVMALAAYLCALYNQAEAIYVESRDRLLISTPPASDLIEAIAKDTLESTKKGFQEERFRSIDVPSYIALYGREMSESIQVDELDKDQVEKAHIIAQYYSTVRNHLNTFQQEVNRAYKNKPVAWPIQIELQKTTRKEREALEYLTAKGILSWNTSQNILSCESEQIKFLKGRWIEIFVLDSLSQSGLFHDVRGNVKIADWDGECDVMLTVNAKLAIIECKSGAKLSDQFGKIRAIQRDLGGVYAQSFFIRSGQKDENMHEQAKFYGINKVIDVDGMPKLVEIIAQHMGVASK